MNSHLIFASRIADPKQREKDAKIAGSLLAESVGPEDIEKETERLFNERRRTGLSLAQEYQLKALGERSKARLR